MILLRQADVYGPHYMGIRDVLICGGKIEAIGENLSAGTSCQIVEADGRKLVPGLIDQHEHMIGGGGEGSFHTRTPELTFSSLVRGGITTAVGLLGTDDVTRSIEGLVARAKAFCEEGLTAYALCGAYGFPSATITGSVKKDIVFINEILGVKLALSDHRAPNVTTDELIRLASDARTAGMIGGKAGIVTIHMGDGKGKLDQIFEALERTSLPVKVFHPTHVGRTHELLKEAFRFAKMGGYIDITCDSDLDEECRWWNKGDMAVMLREAREEGVPMDRITFSSDGQGSWSAYDHQGNLKDIGVTDVGNLYRQLVSFVKQEGICLEEALTYVTSNVAKALGLYPQKGTIAQGADADMLLLEPDLSLNIVMAKGKILMRDGRLLLKGTYE